MNTTCSPFTTTLRFVFSTLFFSVLLLVQSSCGGNNPKPAGSLQMSFTELTLSPDESVRLYCRAGKDEKLPQLTWTSSDPSVATVDNIGYVTAVAAGRTVITASAGELKATCDVFVESSYLATLTFPFATMIGEPDTAFFGGGVKEAMMGGKKIYVYLSLAHLMLFSDGLTLNEDSEIEGALTQGAVVSLYVPMLFGPRNLNDGKVYGSIFNNEITIGKDKSLSTQYYAQAGAIDEKAYTAAIEAYGRAANSGSQDAMFDALDGAVAAISGAQLSLAVYHSREEGYRSDGYVINNLPEALVTAGSFTLLENKQSPQNYKVQGLQLTVKPLNKSVGYYYGAALNYDPLAGYFLADKDMHYLDEVTIKN
ncbi:MAG: Ig-like domain-containing protein [Paludibacteraceae bacterium]|nr:Ig-like domain-containing protein [Paludibacteraceae bacterium]